MSSSMRKRVTSSDPVDVPVLSHAAKRKQRKTLSMKAVSISPPAKKQKKEKDIPDPVKRQNSVWVGNLNYKTTPESLRRFFYDVGEITRVHLPTKLTKPPTGESARRENQGFAYVDFATVEAKGAAIMMTEKPLEGRRLLIKDGDSFEGRPLMHGMRGEGTLAQWKPQSKFARKVLSTQKQPPAPTLFFGNLAFETTVDSIRGLLEAHHVKKENVFGTEELQDPWIRNIRMGTFEDSGLCKGFAFVDFTSTEHATTALIHPNNHQLDGRKLVVEFASADAVRRGGGARLRPKTALAKGTSEDHSRSKKRGSEFSDRIGRNDCEKPTTTNWKLQDEENTASGLPSHAPAKVDKKARKSRPTPGAALALAKREQITIVPSQGRRIIFDS